MLKITRKDNLTTLRSHMATQKRRRRVSWEMEQAIQALYEAGCRSPKQIHEKIEERLKDGSLKGTGIDVRTVQRYVKDIEEADDNSVWSFEPAEEIDPHLVFPVLEDLMTATRGRISTLTRTE